MPLVTNLWFDSFLKVLFWRSLCLFNVMIAATSITTAPIYLNGTKPLSRWFVALWATAALVAIVAAQRWWHWRAIQKQNIFNNDMTPYSKVEK